MSLVPENVLRPAATADLDAVERLLRDSDLPLDGVREQFGPSYAVVEVDGRIVAVEGIERYGEAGLLRSAAVASDYRGQRLGDALTRNRITWAREQGLQELWLLTTTAADYFPRFGFVRTERTSAPEALQQSPEFRDACPASAVAMRLTLS